MTWSLSKTTTFTPEWGSKTAIRGSVVSPTGAEIALDGPAFEFIGCGSVGIAIYMRFGKNAVAYNADGTVAWSAGRGIEGAADDTGCFVSGSCDDSIVRLYNPAGFEVHFRASDGKWLGIKQVD